MRHFPRIFVVLPRHLDAVLTLAEQGLGLQESFSLKANIELLVRRSHPQGQADGW